MLYLNTLCEPRPASVEIIRHDLNNARRGMAIPIWVLKASTNAGRFADHPTGERLIRFCQSISTSQANSSG